MPSLLPAQEAGVSGFAVAVRVSTPRSDELWFLRTSADGTPTGPPSRLQGFHPSFVQHGRTLSLLWVQRAGKGSDIQRRRVGEKGLE